MPEAESEHREALRRQADAMAAETNTAEVRASERVESAIGQSSKPHSHQVWLGEHSNQK